MHLTTKGRYAVTAMLDLALNYGSGRVSLADISERQSISLSYLEQLFSRLRKNDLVLSARGPGGGYKLSRPLREISIFEIIAAVDENIDSTACKGKGNCRSEQRCLSHHLWDSLSKKIQHYLSEVTLENVIVDYQQTKGNKRKIKLAELIK